MTLPRESSSRRVWKYELSTQEHQIVRLPAGWSLLRIGNQGLKPVLWAEVDPRAPIVEVSLFTYVTGAQINDRHDWIGTYQLPVAHEFVGHVYQEHR